MFYSYNSLLRLIKWADKLVYLSVTSLFIKVHFYFVTDVRDKLASVYFFSKSPAAQFVFCLPLMFTTNKLECFSFFSVNTVFGGV